MSLRKIVMMMCLTTGLAMSQVTDPMLDVGFLFSDTLSALAPEKSVDTTVNMDAFLKFREQYEKDMARMNRELTRLRNRVALLEEGRTSSGDVLHTDVMGDYYTQALTSYNEGAYDKAGALFSQIMSETTDTAMRLNSMFWAAECAFRQGNYNRTIILLNEIISNPAFSRLEDGYILLAAAYERLGKDYEAKKYFMSYQRDYPDGRYARLVNRKLGTQQ